MSYKLPFSLSRNSPITEEKVAATKKKLREFFTKNDIHETTLVIDGPGVACLGAYLVPIILGYDNLLKFKEIHTFSAGSYALFWIKAFKDGLQEPNVDFKKFYHWNQRQHGLRFGALSGLTRYSRYLWRKILEKEPTLYDAKQLYRAKAAHYPFGESMKHWNASMLPPNWHLWCYDQRSKSFFALGNRDKQASMSIDATIEATTAIPGIYGAHTWEQMQLIDCVFSPGFKTFARGILRKSRPLIFCNMSRNKTTEQTLYIKAHSSGSAKQRVNGDILRFFGGLGHPEYIQNLGLLEKLAKLEPMRLDG